MLFGEADVRGEVAEECGLCIFTRKGCSRSIMPLPPAGGAANSKALPLPPATLSVCKDSVPVRG